MNTMMDLTLLTEKVRAVAIEAGAFIREERKKFDWNAVEKKHAHDYVSYVDKESEKRLVSSLNELLPEASFIAEEGSVPQNENAPYCWLVDPLDGTTNFIHNNAPYCVSIALRDQKELLLGVVYEITHDECYWTCKGSASYLNGNKIHVSQVNALEDAFIALGFPYASDAYKPIAIHLVDRLYGYVGGLRLMGAAAVELCYVAAGRFEARIEAFLGPWDIAAGALILQNAGGQVTDFKGGNTYHSGRQVLASNGKTHTELLNILGEW